jgi:FMN reductase
MSEPTPIKPTASKPTAIKQPRTIAVVTAGLSQPSSTRLLADQLAAATVSQLPAGAEVVTIELRDLAHDVVNNLLTGFPAPALRQAIDQVTGADAVIAVTPLYSGSYNGLFKSFFDVLDPDALRGKPVLIAATGGTARHSLALEHAIRPLFSYLGTVTVPTAVFAATDDWGSTGRAELTARIERAGGELAALVAQHAPATAADPYASVTPFDQLLRAR